MTHPCPYSDGTRDHECLACHIKEIHSHIRCDDTIYGKKASLTSVRILMGSVTAAAILTSTPSPPNKSCHATANEGSNDNHCSFTTEELIPHNRREV